MPVIQTLTASRNATWAPELAYDYLGGELPLANATIAMQLRLYPGQAGDAKLGLAAIPFVDILKSGTVGSADEVRTLTLSPKFSVEQLAALPGLNSPEAGSSQRFAFDFRITYADEISEILAGGDFILFPGVTA